MAVMTELGYLEGRLEMKRDGACRCSDKCLIKWHIAVFDDYFHCGFFDCNHLNFGEMTHSESL
jgi:hypothetical protein